MKNIDSNEEVGIKYRKIKLDKDRYVLIPVSPIMGYSVGNVFYSTEIQKTPQNKTDIANRKFLIDDIITVSDLELKYLTDDTVGEEDFDKKAAEYNADLDFLINYYYETKKNNIILIETKGRKVEKRIITIPELNEIIAKEKENENSTEVKPINFENDNDMKIAKVKTAKEPTSTVKKDTPVMSDFSVLGLEQYLTERIFGHDEGIRTLATKLYMNYTALDGEGKEDILIVGPTGTGKTETLKTASRYLNLPFKDVNAPDLVPEGYVGTSIQDIVYSLLLQSDFNIEIARRGICLIDELDKLGNASDELKKTMKEILLKYIEGTELTFTRNKKSYSFDTALLTNVFAGAFNRIFEKEGSIGFNASIGEEKSEIKPEEVVKKIKEKKYFGAELIDRIPIPIFYKEVDYYTKREILLYSKISKYLIKKQRYERQFGVTLDSDESYVEAILSSLPKDSESVRQLNNQVIKSLALAEYELCTNPNLRGKRLILTRDTVENPNKFTLM